MRMTGSWHLYQEGVRWRRPRQFARAILDFGEWTAVCFSAPVLQVVRNEAPAVGHLGPDILADEFPLDRVLARARAAGPLPLGELLLDQRICCGIGNVYKCEICFLRGLDPWTPVGEVRDLEGLVALTKRVMEANRSTGTQITTGDTRPGRERWVYGRKGQPCRRCGTPIRQAGSALPLALGFAGAVLIIAPWRSGGSGSLAGELACLGAAACYGVKRGEDVVAVIDNTED